MKDMLKNCTKTHYIDVGSHAQRSYEKKGPAGIYKGQGITPPLTQSAVLVFQGHNSYHRQTNI